MRLTVWAFRILFGLVLGITAIGKLLDNRGFAEVIANYQFFLPEPALLPLGLFISLAELLIAGAIFVGYQLRHSAQLTILIHFGYTALATVTLWRGIELDNCGCFGVFLARKLGWSTVFEDAILTALAIGFLVAVTKLEQRAAFPALGAPSAGSRRRYLAARGQVANGGADATSEDEPESGATLRPRA